MAARGRSRRHHGAVDFAHNGCTTTRDAAHSHGVISTESVNTFDVEQLRHTVLELQSQLLHATALNEKLTHEMAVLKRLKFAAKSEHFNAEQRSLLEEAIDADLEALQRELEQLVPDPPAERERR